ncbi:MAG: hypothetical protein HJJLKODD_00351 [Phycisphaerae bacterium]|nr:hypothetical protein [Phycisphaerae bacterium]
MELILSLTAFSFASFASHSGVSQVDSTPAVTQPAAEVAATQPAVIGLVGTVKDHSGQVVAGASVYAVAHGEGYISYSSATKVVLDDWGNDSSFFGLFKKNKNRSTGSTVTDQAGQFSIPKLKKGNFDLLVVHPTRGIAVVTQIKQPNTHQPLIVQLNAPTFVKGKLLHLPEDQYITLNNVDRLPWEKEPSAAVDRNLIFPTPQIWMQLTAETNANGEFSIGPLPMGGRWALEISQSVPSRNFSFNRLTIPFNITEGQSATIDYDFKALHQLSGLIKGPNDTNIADAAVVLETEKDGLKYQYGCVTDTDGRYSITGVPPGKYTMNVFRHVIKTGGG